MAAAGTEGIATLQGLLRRRSVLQPQLPCVWCAVRSVQRTIPAAMPTFS